jgi:eukaryotic-like serine/threonine-protein kinase
MPLSPGIRIGPYEVIAAAGAGGMGEVYRARDARLNRDVAIKVLPAAFSRDPERLRRFQQEAQAAAALNHPNILAVYDFGEHEGSPYIVTELLEGETLRQRLLAGVLPVRKAIDYAEQIARGLAVAHEKGIVHRDLKPENIFLTRAGRVKILDFGLAKLTRPEMTANPDAATLASQTEPGVVMGTVGYMSPEQVRGQNAGHRSDLFSFGTILYEMLSGKRAFQKSTSAETMTAILKEEPPAFSPSASNIPPLLQQVVNHCLEKDPEQRFQSASDLSFALHALHDASSSSVGAIAASDRNKRWTWIGVAVGAAVLGAALVFLFAHRFAYHAQDSRANILVAILPPPGDGFWANITQPAAISPDGKFLAVVAIREGHKQLWLRRLDVAEAQLIAGSEDAANPFWSPDSRYLAFFVPGKLRKLDVTGGAVTDICPAGSFGMGGAWSSRGVILLATFGAAVKRVQESGGTPESIPGVELSSDAIGQMWPAFLSDGRHFLYLEWRYPTRVSHDDNVWIGSLDGEKARRLPITSTNAVYSAGYLLFERDGDLVAQKFDQSRLELGGAVLPIARNVEFDTFFHDAMFGVSGNGTLVYASAGVGVNTILTWFDRNGKTLGTLGQPDQMFQSAISPDGKRVAVDTKPSDAREKIWIYDVEHGTRVPLEADESGPSLYHAVWSRDGKRIAYRDAIGKTSTLRMHQADGSGQGEQINGLHGDVVEATSWSPDGQFVAYERTEFQGRYSWQTRLQVVRVEGPSEPVWDTVNAGAGQFSPDGHWLAYEDKTSGEIYVAPFPGPGARVAVSSGGGNDVRWRADGKELFYLTNDRTVVAAQIRESAQEFHVLSSQHLFRLQLPWNVGFYDVTPDGQRFLVNTRTYKEQTEPLTLVTDWSAGLQGGGTK